MAQELQTSDTPCLTKSILESHDINGIAKFIKSNQCKKITILSGAGISVSAGIPDYRSKDGFYNTVDINNFISLTDDEKQWISEDIENRILSLELFKFAPCVYLECCSNLLINILDKESIKYIPTLSHWFIKLLDDKNLLKRCYTTNIDGLSMKTGLTTNDNKLFPIHGTLRNIECFACKTRLDEGDEINEFIEKIKSKQYLFETIKCKYCIGNNLGPPYIKPSVVLFGESISFKFFDLVYNKKDLNDIDLMIIIGTTLKVAPSNFLPVICREHNKKTVRLVINKDNVDEYDEIFNFNDKNGNDVFLKGKSDDIIKKLIELLEWNEDLQELRKNACNVEEKYDNNDNNNNDDDDDDDNISYASSNDFIQDGIHEIDEEGHKIHVYVIDKEKESKFKQPVFIHDIDENIVNYAGNIIGNDIDWNDLQQKNEEDLHLDITKTLQTLNIQRTDCKVLVYAEDKLNGDKLVKLSPSSMDESVFDKTEEYDDIKDDVMDNKMDDLALPDKEMLPSISENEEESDNGDIKIDLIKQKSQMIVDRKNQMKALRMKYSSRRVVLHGKKKRKTPKCAECNTYYHIQSDPINAYNGIGIICDICGKNRSDNPEMLLEDHYYKCENCEGIDICSKCYRKEKAQLNKLYKKTNKNNKNKLIGF